MSVSLETIIGNILGCVYVPTAGRHCLRVYYWLIVTERVNYVVML